MPVLGLCFSASSVLFGIFHLSALTAIRNHARLAVAVLCAVDSSSCGPGMLCHKNEFNEFQHSLKLELTRWFVVWHHWRWLRGAS